MSYVVEIEDDSGHRALKRYDCLTIARALELAEVELRDRSDVGITGVWVANDDEEPAKLTG